MTMMDVFVNCDQICQSSKISKSTSILHLVPYKENKTMWAGLPTCHVVPTHCMLGSAQCLVTSFWDPKMIDAGDHQQVFMIFYPKDMVLCSGACSFWA